MNTITVAVTIVTALFGSAGLWTYIDHRKQRSETKEDRQDEILKELKSLHSDIDQLRGEMRENDKNINQRMDWEKADQCRNRILRFDDEIRRGVEHSLEFFNQIITDLDWYESFCQSHPNYKNSKAEEAIRNIRECFHTVKMTNGFV